MAQPPRGPSPMCLYAGGPTLLYASPPSWQTAWQECMRHTETGNSSPLAAVSTGAGTKRLWESAVSSFHWASGTNFSPFPHPNTVTCCGSCSSSIPSLGALLYGTRIHIHTFANPSSPSKNNSLPTWGCRKNSPLTCSWGQGTPWLLIPDILGCC